MAQVAGKKVAAQSSSWFDLSTRFETADARIRVSSTPERTIAQSLAGSTAHSASVDRVPN